MGGTTATGGSSSTGGSTMLGGSTSSSTGGSSTPSGRTLATMMPTLGLAWMIVVQRQVLAMTLLMELSLSQTAQFLASLLVLLPTKMWFGTATMTSRMASLWLMKRRGKSKIVSRSIRL